MASPGEIEIQNRLAAEFFSRCKVYIPGKVLRAMDEAIKDLQAQGSKLAPVDKSFLRANIEEAQDPITIQGSILTGTVAARLPYAKPQHENDWYNHPKGGQAFYLSEPLAERQAMYQSNIGQAIMEAIKEANQ